MFSITDRARQQIKEMLKDEPENSRLRFGIKGGGCSGLSYALGFDDEVNEDLDMIDEINEIAIVIAKEDLGILENTEIDFKENMMGGGFTINNPNAVMSCEIGRASCSERVSKNMSTQGMKQK